MISVFLDANVFLRFLTGEPKDMADKAWSIFENLRQGKWMGYIDPLVMHEVIYVATRVYSIPKLDCIEKLSALLQMNTLEVMGVSKTACVKALNRYGESNLDFPDCIYLEICDSSDLNLITFDKDFIKYGVDVM